MNASFIRERQWYGAVVTAGPLSTHHMILFATPVWKNISSSSGPRENHRWTLFWPCQKSRNCRGSAQTPKSQRSKRFSTRPSPPPFHPSPSLAARWRCLPTGWVGGILTTENLASSGLRLPYRAWHGILFLARRNRQIMCATAPMTVWWNPDPRTLPLKWQVSDVPH